MPFANLENLIEDNNGFLLFQALEKAKIELSFYEKSTIFFREQKLEIREPVERKEFEEAIHGHTARIAACIDETVKKAGLAPGDIDVVFTTGGTSHIPCIKDLFVQRFGLQKMQHRDAFTSVAYGLGAAEKQTRGQTNGSLKRLDVLLEFKMHQERCNTSLCRLSYRSSFIAAATAAANDVVGLPMILLS